MAFISAPLQLATVRWGDGHIGEVKVAALHGIGLGFLQGRFMGLAEVHINPVAGAGRMLGVNRTTGCNH